MLVKTFLLYSDAGYDETLMRLARNMFRIPYYQWIIPNRWYGLVNRKQYKRIIESCKKQNRRILKKYFNEFVVEGVQYKYEDVRFVLNKTRHRGKDVAILEIWKKK